ncbi:TetR/AcrR family transcriptional regulator [Fluviicola taffensis]|uniref:Regulatory protein TetR n=1 Tax=Fluviicola taffensis (strain DSM 16823 / NCIMB 13979 / RW262) TaxID=755732 RepID=F2IEV1_FLUTR|nr:TetR/AcrR family transcriptional regulator [Fluviicola taffensis]AEA45668.1 regulatory protein TetR [Fluviicola taffensis DSM 16823]
MKLDITARQIEIIEASGKILMNKGIAALTTKNLAQEMGFSESALYRHFKDKEAIVSLLIQYLADNINQRFEQILISNISEEEKYLALFKSQFQYFKKNPHFIVIVLSDGLMDSSEIIKNSIVKLIQTNAKSFKTVLENGQKASVFTSAIEADYLVHFIMGAFRLQMLKWKLANFSFDIEKNGMKTMATLLTLIKQ